MNPYRHLLDTDPQQFRFLRREMQRENRLQSTELTEQPVPPMPNKYKTASLRCWRSRGFLVTLFQQEDGHERLSINRTELQSDGNWKEAITWDEIQRLKAEAGFGDRWAVEVYPPGEELINVANIRHIFLLPSAPDFAWRKEGK